MAFVTSGDPTIAVSGSVADITTGTMRVSILNGTPLLGTVHGTYSNGSFSVNVIAAETFIDNVDRMAFDNWEEHERLYGTLPGLVELDLLRAKVHRQIPQHVRKLIATQAERIVPVDAAA